MYCYIKTPVAPRGTVPGKGSFEFVYALGDATQLDEEVAKHVLLRVYDEWRDRKWEIENVGHGKYIIKGASIK